jgi:hypothetical protein
MLSARFVTSLGAASGSAAIEWVENKRRLVVRRINFEPMLTMGG